MKQDGITLIELLIVVSIIAILTVALGFQFSGWMLRYKVESQIKTMQADLSAARQRALEKNIQYVVQLPVLNAQSYTICEDTNLNNICDVPAETTGSPISQSLSKSGLEFLIMWDVPGGAGGQIVMNGKGMAKTAQGAAGTLSDITTNAVKGVYAQNIWLVNPLTKTAYGPTPNSGQPNTANQVDYDCISVTSMRIDLGKYDGVSCVVR